MSKEYTVKIQTFMSTIRTDGNGTRIIDTNSEVEMLKQLKRMATDNDVSKVLVNIKGSTKEFIRHINEYEIGDMKVGALKELNNGHSPFIDPTAYTSSLSVIMGNTCIKPGSVVMGNTIYENVVVDNKAAYDGDSQYWISP